MKAETADRKATHSECFVRLKARLTRHFEIHRTEMTKPAAEEYQNALAHLTAREIDLAFDELTRSHLGRFPATPAQILECLHIARSRLPATGSRAREDCKFCGGTGWTLKNSAGKRLTIEEQRGFPRPEGFAVKCSCAGGGQ